MTIKQGSDMRQRVRFDDLFTFARDSTGAGLQENGGELRFISMAANQHRLNRSLVEVIPGVPLGQGLLIEPQKTNRCLWSRDLTQSEWVKENATVTRAEGMDGAENAASRVQADADNASVRQSITDPEKSRTFSCMVRAVNDVQEVEVNAGGFVWGTRQLGAGWNVVNVTQTSENPNVGIRLKNAGDIVDVDFCQEENGGWSTPIPTADAAVTRLVDDARITGLQDAKWFGEKGITIVIRASMFANPDQTFSNVFILWEGNSDTFFEVRRTTSSGSIGVRTRAQSTNNASIALGTIGPLQSGTIAVSLDNNGRYAGSMNGGEVASNFGTIVDISKLSEMFLGRYFSAGRAWNGALEGLRIIDRAVSDQELRELSNGNV
jgi:hypothetical protein